MASHHLIGATAVLGAALAAPAGAVPLSFTVTGQVGTPTTATATSLAALPQSTQTVTFRAGGNPVTDTVTGPTLWSVLGAAGGIAVDPALKNDVLRRYVVATGSDGYQAVISAGEISPRFGNRPDLVATADASNQLPSPSGFARLVAAGDIAGGRYVSNLTNLAVHAAPARPGAGGGASAAIAVGGAVDAPISFTLPRLQSLPSHTATVTFQSGTTSVTDTYTGALLWDVLNAAGVQTDGAVKNDILRKLVTATGTDGYEVAFALGELSPGFGNAPILVAYADTAGQIAGGAGFARLVVPGDLAGGRFVSNLYDLTVFDGTAVPEPAGLAILAVALAGLGLCRGRAAGAAA